MCREAQGKVLCGGRSSGLCLESGGGSAGSGQAQLGRLCTGAPILPDWSVSLLRGPTGHGLHPALWAWQGLWVARGFGQCQEAAADLSVLSHGSAAALHRSIHEAEPWGVVPLEPQGINASLPDRGP